MTPEQKRITDNLDKTFELIELSKNLSIAKIMQDHPAVSSKEAEILFWKEVRRIKIFPQRLQRMNPDSCCETAIVSLPL